MHCAVRPALLGGDAPRRFQHRSGTAQIDMHVRLIGRQQLAKLCAGRLPASGRDAERAPRRASPAVPERPAAPRSARNSATRAPGPGVERLRHGKQRRDADAAGDEQRLHRVAAQREVVARLRDRQQVAFADGVVQARRAALANPARA